MNDESSFLGHMEDDRRSSSPKRKKIRQKYAPKACVSCRRSKLKCSGENPCQRCLDNGKRCFYSEDQTAAEALQNLSRPHATPAVQPSLPSLPSNGASLARRNMNILPRHESIERRASDASMLVSTTMEVRMARIEAMMEALIHERGMTMTPMGSIEREESGSEGFHGETQFAMPILDPINPALTQMDQSSDMPFEVPDWTQPEPPAAEFMLQVGNRRLAFPRPDDYHQYLTSFFEDLHLRYPCIEEAAFRARGKPVLATGLLPADAVVFLALNYIIFACCDVLRTNSPSVPNSTPPGWHWVELADSLVDKRTLLDSDLDHTVLQFLLFQSLYHVFTDSPRAAYTTIGLASRLVFQHGLHQYQHQDISASRRYYRNVLFWVIFVADRFISLSCRRPCSIRSSDIDLDIIFPADYPILNKHFPTDFLNFRISLAHHAGRLSDAIAAPPGQPPKLVDGDQFLMEEHLHKFLDYKLPLSSGVQPNTFDTTVVHLQRNTVSLYLRYEEMVSHTLDVHRGRTMSDFALDSISRLRPFAHEFEDEAFQRSSYSQKGLVISAISSALLTLGTQLMRDPSAGNLQSRSPKYANGFWEGVRMLDSLETSSQYARRVVDEFKPFRSAVETFLHFNSIAPARNTLPFDDLRKILPFTGVTSVPVPEHDRRPGILPSRTVTRPASGVLWLI